MDGLWIGANWVINQDYSGTVQKGPWTSSSRFFFVLFVKCIVFAK